MHVNPVQECLFSVSAPLGAAQRLLDVGCFELSVSERQAVWWAQCTWAGLARTSGESFTGCCANDARHYRPINNHTPVSGRVQEHTHTLA